MLRAPSLQAAQTCNLFRLAQCWSFRPATQLRILHHLTTLNGLNHCLTRVYAVPTSNARLTLFHQHRKQRGPEPVQPRPDHANSGTLAAARAPVRRPLAPRSPRGTRQVKHWPSCLSEQTVSVIERTGLPGCLRRAHSGGRRRSSRR